MANETTDRALMDYNTADFIRLATEEECEASDNANDGGVGAFTAIVDGQQVTCYVTAADCGE